MKKKTLIRYAVFLILGLIIAVCNFSGQGLFKEENLAEKMGILSDCFLFPAILFGGIGALSWIASQGNFDMLSFGFSHFIMGIVRPRLRQESFYEYKMRKEEKQSGWAKEMFLSGMFYFVICFLFLALYLYLGE